MINLFWLQLGSVIGAMLVGIWLPLRMIGFIPMPALEIAFDLIVSTVAGINIALYFQGADRSFFKKNSWLDAGLILDVICFLPITIVAFVFFDSTSHWILFLNLLCARHIRQIKPLLDHFDSLKPMTYRLLPIALMLPLLVHIIACGWIGLGSGTAGIDSDPVLRYVKALYWAFSTLTTVGYGDIHAQTVSQMLYCCSVQLVGVGVFGFIVSNVASLLSRSDSNREHHMDNLDRVETFMRTHQIPNELRLKTRSYYHYLWMNKRGYQDRSLLKDLPSKLQGELLFIVNRSIIKKVPFLKDADPEMIMELMFLLEPKVFVPGERIFKAGDVGDSIYFIHTGEVEIQSADGISLAHLSDGAFFGEMAILTDGPRSATAVATSFCDVHELHRSSFETVANVHPSFKSHIQNVMSDRRQSA